MGSIRFQCANDKPMLTVAELCIAFYDRIILVNRDTVPIVSMSTHKIHSSVRALLDGVCRISLPTYVVECYYNVEEYRIECGHMRNRNNAVNVVKILTI